MLYSLSSHLGEVGAGASNDGPGGGSVSHLDTEASEGGPGASSVNVVGVEGAVDLDCVKQDDAGGGACPEILQKKNIT